MSDQRFTIPPKLLALVQLHNGQEQDGVRFRLPSWIAALDGVDGDPARLLADPVITTESTFQRYRNVGDRVVTREAVTGICTSLDLGDDDAVVAAFVLVMAWGSGTSNGRSFRNTRAALKDTPKAAAALRDSASALRAIKHVDDPSVLSAHRQFSLPGIGEPFFTKWFAFAGVVPERDWQPLILDSRVRATLYDTLMVWLNNMSEKRSDPERYVAYLAAMHAWAAELPQPMTATRLEWIVLRHSGRPA